MRNPTRRSRNIGTAKQGHGQNNRLVLPFSCHLSSDQFPFSLFYENLHEYQVERRLIGNQEVAFLTEKPRPCVVHACSVEDIVRVLSVVPVADMEDLNLVILRQPKRKEEVLSPVWGRYRRAIDIGCFSGNGIILESLDLNRRLRWEKPLLSHDVERLERLRSQGHVITETRRFFLIASSVESVRETQLFETLPHEVGHHVHALTDENFDERTTREKEDFAEKYARKFMQKFGALLKEDEARKE